MRRSVLSPDETLRRELKLGAQRSIFDELRGVSSGIFKLINYSYTDDPISLHQLSQVHVFWYPMNIPIKTHSISSKTDQDTDQETWILISLNTKYSIFSASIITYNNNRATYYSFNFSVVEIDRVQ